MSFLGGVPKGRVTIAAVNAALRAAGHDAELVKGKDYFWFAGPETLGWDESSVYTPRLSGQSIADWVADYERLKAYNESMGR